MNRAPSIALRRPRGFTLVELLAVLAIISMLVVTASPTFVNVMRDRRVNRAAMHLVDSYRTARTRSMGRGQPVVAVWDGANGAQTISVAEPVVSNAKAAPSCDQATWTNELSRIDFRAPAYESATAVLVDGAGAPVTHAEVCFTPTGRTYMRTAASGAFTLMTVPMQFQVKNIRTKLTRLVFVPPSGVARMQL